MVGMVMAVSPMIPPVSALDPTPDPGASATATDVPTVAPDPNATPVPDPTVAPVPTVAPDPSVAPSPAVTPAPDPSASAAPSTDPSAVPSVEPTLAPTATGLTVEHFWVDQENEAGTIASLGTLDDPRIGLTRFVVYRVRFQVLNNGTTDARLVPVLNAGAGRKPASWADVPAEDLEAGRPFYAASDNGSTYAVRSRVIPVDALRLATSRDPAAVAVPGMFSAGRNPAVAISLPAGTFTEIEFAVRATVDAAWESAYAFRLMLGTPLLDQVDAAVSLGAAPPVNLSPGQKRGVIVDAPVPLYRLQAPTGAVSARLASVQVTPNAAPLGDPVGPMSYTSPHAQYTLADDSCAVCHSAHRATGRVLLQAASPVATLCFRCHDGTGATANIQGQYASPTIPANNATTSSYYSHPATTASNHTMDGLEEFAGAAERHAECSDCHQPHLSDATVTAASTTGWTVGGAIKGASGVAVTNGAANTVPTYTWQRTNQYEYQLCYKCHSSYTTLPAQQAGFPSRWALDKAVEFNPANLSFHPVEAAGKNATAQMTANLAGTSPYKLWTFTASSVIRCENCHGPGTATNPAVDAQIDNHASANRGILLRNYRDRVLNTRTQPYAAVDFALCYLCHAEAPMVDPGADARADTNFRYHGFHVSGLLGEGSATAGTAIDTDGAGAGNATCAECHFRIHGSSYPVDGQAPASRLVNFSPSITPSANGQIRFVQRVGGTIGSCTLTCHGKDHEAKGY
jgi:predicted CXXCH cytochrome family protein